MAINRLLYVLIPFRPVRTHDHGRWQSIPIEQYIYPMGSNKLTNYLYEMHSKKNDKTKAKWPETKLVHNVNEFIENVNS